MVKRLLWTTPWWYVCSVYLERGHSRAQKENPGLDEQGWSETRLDSGSPGVLQIQRDPIFGPSEVNVGDTLGAAVQCS